MWNRLQRISAPATEPVTLEQAKAHLRVDADDDDDLIARLLKVARDQIDGPHGAGLAMVSQQWRLSLDVMPAEIRVPMGPVLSVDEVSYLDGAGDRQTLASAAYSWRKDGFGARIRPVYNGTWPLVRHDHDSVQVTFTAGFDGTGDSPVSLDNVPDALKHAMLLLVGAWYENREHTVIGVSVSEMPMPVNVQSLIDKYRVGRF